MTSLLVTAPEPVREKYRGLSRSELIERLSMCRPAEQLDTPHAAALYSLRELARSHQRTQQQADDLENQMLQLLSQHLPQLLNIYGAGTIVATQLAVTAGGNPKRIRNEAAFAQLCGVAPIPASSGRTNRHRLNSGGDRRGNKALHRIVLVRMRHDQRTKEYVQRRTEEGKGEKEIMRCLKRALAREVYRALTTDQQPAIDQPNLKTLRTGKGITLTQAAQALNTWPARISDIEHHRRPLPELSQQYEHWLKTA